ncbi:hypothetical protein B0H66DRAFT_373821 [Apodospora peruviana]|uniref:C2H2-type domain-containing protein n=1 Tax=Apodospora peruviana TaxID=516989 RepID=A0AAE0HWK4_9PEZI|nr:hypothetical protein B0H66DRAFT_373821 [Apodospora peruviana]
MTYDEPAIQLSNGLATPEDDHDPETPIPLASKIIHKFYEPIILLVSLIGATKAGSKPPLSDTSLNEGLSQEQLFHAFVNKLAHLCAYAKGNETVTSFTVLQDSSNGGQVYYLFAANDETREDLEGTADYVRKLLRRVSQAPKDMMQLESVRKTLLRDVLLFNKPRIGVYLRKLQEQAAKCLEMCATDETSANQLVSEHLNNILNTDNSDAFKTAGSFMTVSEAEHLKYVTTIIELLIKLERSEAEPVIKSRAEEGRMMPGVKSKECWSKFLHTVMRIRAYPQSVKFMLLARRNWPQLFDNNPVVSFLPSSSKIPKPVREKSLKAENIVNRMTRKEKEKVIFKDFVRRLQAFDLDKRIADEYAEDSFQPRVHSEILILNYLWNNHGLEGGGIDPTVFFNGWRYIGSSKPMCRLCSYYFEEHRSGVGHRECHGNLYPAWRFPDVLPWQGDAGTNARQIMVDRVLQRVRKNAFEIVRKKITPVYKEQDSNTFTEAVTLDDRWAMTMSRCISPATVERSTSPAAGERNIRPATVKKSIRRETVDEITALMGQMAVRADFDQDDHDDEIGGARL